MINTQTSYAGLILKTPIVAASSGLTANINKIKELVKAGAGAVVLKSLFEEQIEAQGEAMLTGTEYPEAADYIAEYVRGDQINKYLDLIREVKAFEPSVPVIASINCFRSDAWTNFACNIESAGADAIELNIMRIETDLYYDVEKHDHIYTDIVQSIAKSVKIPVTVKLSRWLTAVPALVDKLRAAGARGVVLFNRAYRTDVDVEQERITSGDIFTQPQDIQDTLRFIGITSASVPNISLAASTGVHSWEEVVKSILVGASAAQMCSVIYKEGSCAIARAQAGLEDWMKRRGYHTIDEFCGRLNAKDVASATLFERMQFMKYFSKHDA